MHQTRVTIKQFGKEKSYIVKKSIDEVMEKIPHRKRFRQYGNQWIAQLPQFIGDCIIVERCIKITPILN